MIFTSGLKAMQTIPAFYRFLCLFGRLLTMWHKMKQLCWVTNKNIYTKLSIRKELVWKCCSNAPDLPRIGINVSCTICFSDSEKYPWKNYLGQDYKKHHAEFSIEDKKYENNKQLICDIIGKNYNYTRNNHWGLLLKLFHKHFMWSN